jgi:hypothetical protein
MCKCLHENITILSHTGFVRRRLNITSIDRNKLIIKDKQHFLEEVMDPRGTISMVHQLHSFLPTRGGSRGSG